MCFSSVTSVAEEFFFKSPFARLRVVLPGFFLLKRIFLLVLNEETRYTVKNYRFLKWKVLGLCFKETNRRRNVLILLSLNGL